MIEATLTHPRGVPSTLIERALGRFGATASVLARDAGMARLAIAHTDLATARAALAFLEPYVDIIVRDAAPDPPRLLVADMDSTMVACECLDELADYADLKPQVAAITERAMRGELDFARSLTERVALLAGLPVAAIATCLAERVRPSPGARTLIATLKARGVRTVLATGGFTAFAEPVAAMLGFDRVVANRFEVDGGRLTGRVAGAIVDAATKRAVLLEEAAAVGGPGHTVAVGDGANDLPMLGAAGLGVAYRAKPTVAAAAHARIAHGDLTTLLWSVSVPAANWSVLP